MAKQATKTAARPAPKPAQRAAAGNKASQAARHQGRAEPEPRRAAAPPPQQQQQRRPAAPAVVKPTGQEVMTYGNAANVPAFMRQDMDAGKENIGREDIETPRMKLMQGTSKEINAYDDLKPGHFFHTASETIFDEPFRAVLIYMDRRYILWRPLENGGGILARADDGIHWSPASGSFDVTLDRKDGGNKVNWKVAKTVQQSGLNNWGTLNPENPNSPPAATLMYNFVMAFPDLPDLMPAAFTFQRSSIKVGRRLNTKIKAMREPLYGVIWNFDAVEDHNSAGQDFFNVSVQGGGLVEDEKQYLQYKAMNEMFRQSGLSVKDLEGLQEEDEAGNETGDQGGGEGRPQY